MKREIAIARFGGRNETANIIIDKNGMRIDDKNPPDLNSNDVIHSFISGCINMDAWKHGWHLDVSEAQYKNLKKGKETRQRIKTILIEKLEKRKEEIQMIKDCIQVLGRWK